MKLKAKIKNHQLIVRVKLSRGNTVNDQELDIFSRKYIRGFLKPRKLKKTLLEYAGPVGISIAERLQKSLSKHDFFFLMEQVIDTTQKLRANGLDQNQVIWDTEKVFINQVTKEVQFLYLPVTPSQSGADVRAFMESIIYAVKPEQEQDTDYISQFVYFLKALPEYEPEKLEQYILRADKSVVNIIKKRNVGQSGFMTSSQKDYYDHYAKQNDGDEEATGLLEEDEEATGLLAQENDAGLSQDIESEEGTALLRESEEGTALLSAAAAHFPTLRRVSTQETIYVNKPVFRMGKAKGGVDYFVDNNPAVSRSHADIVTRGKRYFVIDLNSKNKTYINEQPLPAQSEVEIFEGNLLKLASEEFVFYE